MNKRAAFSIFPSILQSVEQGEGKISKRDLFSRMLSNAWFTVNYFHVSFGKQDLIQNAIHKVKNFEKIAIDENRVAIAQKLKTTSNKETEKILWHFDKNVPHWFLSPWFPKVGSETDSVREKRIYAESSSFKVKTLYGCWMVYTKQCKTNRE